MKAKLILFLIATGCLLSAFPLYAADGVVVTSDRVPSLSGEDLAATSYLLVGDFLITADSDKRCVIRPAVSGEVSKEPNIRFVLPQPTDAPLREGDSVTFDGQSGVRIKSVHVAKDHSGFSVFLERN